MASDFIDKKHDYYFKFDTRRAQKIDPLIKMKARCLNKHGGILDL